MKIGSTSLLNLAKLGDGVKSKRFSSYDKTGGNADWWSIKAGETISLAEIEGAGAIRHIWMTTGEKDNNLRGLVIKMYWDGEETPSVKCPLGDFFGMGHGKPVYLTSLPLQTFYLGMNCWFPMPFAKGARITVTNEMDNDSILYFYIDYQEWNESPADMGRFHACWKRQMVIKKEEVTEVLSENRVRRLNTTGKDNYIILEAEGKGHYVGCVLHLDTDETGWWGEGDDMIFIDGEEWPPRLHGTGTEDYFCGAWNYNLLQQPYCSPYFGYHFKGNNDYTGKHSQYRFHIEDPVYFEKSIRVTIEHGHANNKQGDWSSTAYWYQIGRKKELPDVGEFNDRIPYAFGGIERHPGKARTELPR